MSPLWASCHRDMTPISLLIPQDSVEIAQDSELKTGTCTVFREINVHIIKRVYSRSEWLDSFQRGMHGSCSDADGSPRQIHSKLESQVYTLPDCFLRPKNIVGPWWWCPPPPTPLWYIVEGGGTFCNRVCDVSDFYAKLNMLQFNVH